MAKSPEKSSKSKTPMISRGFGFVDATPEPASWAQTLRAISGLLATAKGDGKKVTTLSARGLVIEFTNPVTLSQAGLSGLNFEVKEVKARKSGGGSINVLLEPLTKDSKVRDDAAVGTQEHAPRQIVRTGDPVDLEELKVSSAFRKGVAELRKMLAETGASLEEIGERAGIDDPAVLIRLPVVSMRSAHEFLGMTRQNVQRLANDETLDFGTKIEGKFYFSVEELVLFRQIPRPHGVNRSQA